MTPKRPMLRLRIHRLEPYDEPGGWVYEIRDTSRPSGNQILHLVTAASWRHALASGLADLKRTHERKS